ncbi:MAG: hypothetical protein DRQ46_02925 [Gammaproteobacteria bacterium]|nr:MAG: hypothetical protein DRQ46_02925 [Gammaproteobacteria bacterium]
MYEREWHSSILKHHHPSVSLKPPADTKFIRYSIAAGDDYNSKFVYNITKTYDTQLRSQYGYVWRGIQRPYDRENSIAGGEIAVVDLQTNEILGLWRSFARTGKKDHQIWWLGGETCYKRTGKNDFYQFITTVLKPGK